MRHNWKFTPNVAGGGNWALDCGDFHISFNPCPCPMVGFFASDDGGAETALVKGDQFYILNGDWRAEYEARADDGFDACLDFFNQKRSAHQSSWSNEPA